MPEIIKDDIQEPKAEKELQIAAQLLNDFIEGVNDTSSQKPESESEAKDKSPEQNPQVGETNKE